jgi:hypothetical protein
MQLWEQDAVRWRVLQRSIQDIRARNAGGDPDVIQSIVDEAVGEVRGERRAKGKADDRSNTVSGYSPSRS